MTVVESEAMQVFSNLTNLTTIKLHNNPWKCECQLQPLVSFVQARYKQVIFLYKYLIYFSCLC